MAQKGTTGENTTVHRIKAQDGSTKKTTSRTPAKTKTSTKKPTSTTTPQGRLFPWGLARIETCPVADPLSYLEHDACSAPVYVAICGPRIYA